MPQPVRPHAGLDDKVLALYGRGLTVHAIHKFLDEIYPIEVSPNLSGEVTDAGLLSSPNFSVHRTSQFIGLLSSPVGLSRRRCL